jgi:hypothetical protein
MRDALRARTLIIQLARLRNRPATDPCWEQLGLTPETLPKMLENLQTLARHWAERERLAKAGAPRGPP